MTPEQQIETLTEIVGELKDQVSELSQSSPQKELQRLRRTVEAQQQQIVELTEFVSLVTEAIPGELFPSYHLRVGGQIDGIDIQPTAGRERARRWAQEGVRQIAKSRSAPLPGRGEKPAPSPVRGGGLLQNR